MVNPHLETKNSDVIDRELNWLDSYIAYRLNQYFNHGDRNFANQPMAPSTEECGTAYARLVQKHYFSEAERLAIALALACHLRPAMLDPFFTRNETFGRAFTEFGGQGKGSDGAFQPTAQTALFILSGNETASRIRYMNMFSHLHPLFKEEILDLPKGDHSVESPIHWPLVLTQSSLDILLYGQKRAPEFSSAFPAKRVTSLLDWDDLVLNADTMEQVLEVLSWIQHKDQILQGWNMRKHIRGGFKTLFTGPPGTGKTLTASLIGKKSELDVYRVDLSAVVSKYIGETEKNLERIFTRAENENWILFFDEADALFGKRTQVKDAHDRYANQDVSYLLQRLEDYPGVCILASNLGYNIDDAFLRRLHSVVTFPEPSPSELAKLWKNSFGTPSRLDASVDLPELSRRFKLTGGHLVNIARSSALKAITRGDQKISLNDIETGIRKELRKSGRSS